MIKVYPIQQCPNCSKNNIQHAMICTNDGNKHKKCSVCNWEWRAPFSLGWFGY
jgi:hypothetical protein